MVTIMPEVARSLGGLHLYGWVFSAFLLGSMVGIVAAGREADRTGPARPYVAGLALFGAGLVVAGLAPSMAVLVIGRILQGLGAGAVPAVAYVAIGRSFPELLRAADDGGPVHRLGGARHRRPPVQRRRGPPVRLALGVPGPAAAGGHHRGAGPARAGRSGPSGQATGQRAPPGGRAPRRSGDRTDHRGPDRRASRPRPGRWPRWGWPFCCPPCAAWCRRDPPRPPGATGHHPEPRAC